jgi:DNA invertase Pin-like site-specific DNA recombinase
VALFEDDHVSGRRADRGGVEEMLAAAERGEFALVAVAELSRIGRSIAFVHAAVERLTKAGVRIALVSTGTILDAKTLEGKALLGALALASEVEWHLIQERNARGRETIKARGVKVGRKPREVSEAAVAALREKGDEPSPDCK